MAYDAANDRDKELKTIFLRPGNNLIADEFDYGTVDLDIYPGMCLDLNGKTKFSSGDATNKGGYYTPQVADFDTDTGGIVTDIYPVSRKIKTRLCTPGTLVSIRVGAGTTTNYAVGTKLVNQAHIAAADSTGLTFNSGTLELSTVCHFEVAVAPSANLTSEGLIVARCIPPLVLKDVA